MRDTAMTNMYKYTGIVAVAVVVGVVLGFFVGQSIGYGRGVLEAEIVSASTEALRTQELLKLLDTSKTSDVHIRLNIYLDEKLIALDTLTRSSQRSKTPSSAVASLHQAIAYRKAHPFVSPGGPEVTDRLRKILETENPK